MTWVVRGLGEELHLSSYGVAIIHATLGSPTLQSVPHPCSVSDPNNLIGYSGGTFGGIKLRFVIGTSWGAGTSLHSLTGVLATEIPSGGQTLSFIHHTKAMSIISLHGREGEPS